MNPNDFKQYIENPKSLNKESLETLNKLSQEFPYCAAIHTLLAKNHYILNTPEKDNFLKKAAIYAGDRKKLYRFMHDLPEEIIVEHYTPAYSLENSIDDYSVCDASNENSPESDLISKFLQKKVRFGGKPNMENDVEEEELPSEEEKNKEFLSESLAQIYWKQGNIDKAIQCFEKLSLILPEKSTYFAAQIEKIKKGII